MKPTRTAAARMVLPLLLAGTLDLGGRSSALAQGAAPPAPAEAGSPPSAAEREAEAPPTPPQPSTEDGPKERGEIDIKEPEPPPPPAPAETAPPRPATDGAATAAAGVTAAAPGRTPVTGKFSAELYGFVELDTILDTTQGMGEVAGNAILAKEDAFAGRHKRLQFGARNSRIGLRIKGPESESHTIRASGILEMDFLGNQPTVSEAALYNNPTFRIRHMIVKLETPVLDLLAGQYWQLFGWGSYFHPNTVEIQGLPAQVFSRTAQFRVSHSFKSDGVTVDLAVAAARPPQRDSALPDAQGGIRLLINNWKGLRTVGSAGTSVDAAGIGISGVYRHFRVAEFKAQPVNNVTKDAGAISIDALLPIAPATADHKQNALTLTGSYVRGTGIADLFTGLTGGIGYPSLPNPMMTSPVPTYSPNIDPGLVTFDAFGDPHTIDWQAFLVGMQYYLPPSGNVWLSANYSHLNSPNIDQYATGSMAPKVFKVTEWADVNLFVDILKSVRIGAELAWFRQRFADDSTAKNYRTQLSGFYIF